MVSLGRGMTLMEEGMAVAPLLKLRVKSALTFSQMSLPPKRRYKRPSAKLISVGIPVITFPSETNPTFILRSLFQAKGVRVSLVSVHFSASQSSP